MDKQLKKEVQKRDNQNEIKALQDQIDAYVKSTDRMKVKEDEYKQLLNDYSKKVDEEGSVVGELRAELR